MKKFFKQTLPFFLTATLLVGSLGLTIFSLNIPYTFADSIAFDNAADCGKPISSASSLTCSYTTGSGTNRIMFVLEAHDSGVTNISSITYNGVGLTKINSTTANAGSPNFATSLWYLVAPASGAHNLVINWTVAVGGNLAGADVETFTGASQTGVPDSSNNKTQFAVTFTMSTTVVGSNAWLIGANVQNAPNGCNGPGFGSVRASNNNGGNTCWAINDTNGTVGTGSQSLSFTTAGGNVNQGGVIASFVPAAVTDNSLFFGD